MRKPFLPVAAAAATLGLAAGAAHAQRGVSWSIGINVPGVATVVGNAPPVVYAPPPVYYAPAPVYQPVPVYPAPVAPGPYYAPPPAAYYPQQPSTYYPPPLVYAPQGVPPVPRVLVAPGRGGWVPPPVTYAPPVVVSPPVVAAPPHRHWRGWY